MNFIKAVQALVDAGIEFVLIGGWAAILHGSAYITRDLDICYSRTTANLRRLASALASFHPRPRGLAEDLPFVWDHVTLRNGTVFTLKTDLGDIDLLGEVAGVGTYEDARAHAVLMPAFDREVWTLDLPALIKSKRAAGRTKDLLLLPELESLLEAEDSD